MGIGSFTIAAEPAPAAVGQLHICQPLDSGSDHFLNFLLIENRVVVVAPKLLGPLSIVTDFLGIEVGSLCLYILQIKAHF